MDEVEKYINRNNVISLLTDLVEIYSPYFREVEVMEYAYDWLYENGLPVKYHRFYEDKITDFRGVNVIGNLKGSKKGPRILLNGHLDTVEVCEGWTREPLKATVEGNNLYGTGALDMKSGSAALMLALKAFNNIVDNFNGEILYTLVCDEEGPYGLGTDSLIMEGKLENIDAAIVPEPSGGFTDEKFPCLCLGARGGWKYTVDVKGKSAHGAEPENGINAISEAAKLLIELEKSELKPHDRLGKGSICVIEMAGGGAPLSVPDQAQFSVFRHVVIGESRKYLREEVKKAAEKADLKASYTLSFRDAPHPDNAGFMPYVTSDIDPMTELIKDSIKRVTGKEANIAYFCSVGDFNYLGSRLKTPTYLFGPIGENYHAADEYVEIDSVVKTAGVIYDYLVEVLKAGRE